MELFLTMRKRADFPNMMTYTPEDMPMDVVLRALDIVAESKSPQVLFKGNEAFLHPELEMILKGCQKRARESGRVHEGGLHRPPEHHGR